MAITGEWTLFYDWNCDGSYSTGPITLNPNGTFTQGTYTGTWVQVAGMLTFQFKGSSTTYSGNWASKSITGIMSTFSGLNGCYYMLQSGAPQSFEAKQVAGKLDAAGK